MAVKYILGNSTPSDSGMAMSDVMSTTFQYVINSTDLENVTHNMTSDPCAYLYLVPDPVTAIIQKYVPYVVLTLCIVAFICGVTGNGTLLVIIIREKDMRHVTNIYLFSIALGDFLFIIVFTPFTIFIYGLKDWPFDEATCKFITFLQTFSMGISVFTLTVLSWDQYRTSHRACEQRTSTLKTTVYIASAVWVAAISFGVIDLVAATLEPMHPNCSDLVFCGSRWGQPFAEFRTILDFVVFCSVPAVIMLFFYSSVACRVQGNKPREGQRERLSITTDTKKVTAAHRKREVRISVGLAVLFLFCVLPMQIFKFWFYFIPIGTFNNFWYIFKICGFVTTFINSCINPIALCILSDQFRRYFKKYLCCIRQLSIL